MHDETVKYVHVQLHEMHKTDQWHRFRWSVCQRFISRVWVRNYNAMQILPWRWLCNLTAGDRTNLVSSVSLSDRPLKTQLYEP